MVSDVWTILLLCFVFANFEKKMRSGQKYYLQTISVKIGPGFSHCQIELAVAVLSVLCSD